MEPEVIVIGAGIVGVATAIHLQKRGKKVLLVDRRAPGEETSYGNSGIIETSYVLPFGLPSTRRFPRMLLNLDTAVRFRYRSMPRFLPWIVDFYFESQSGPRQIHGKLLRPLVAPSLDEHRALMQGTDAAQHLTSAGRVKLHRSEESFLGAVLERKVATETGVPFEVMTAAQFSEIEPSLKPAYHKAVRWTSSARLTNPGAVVKAYADKFVHEGGGYVQAEVSRLVQEANATWSLETGDKKIAAKQIVLCAGPWAAELYKPLGYDFPLALKRGYHQHFAALGSARLAHAFVDADIGYLLCPMEKGYRITTGIEFASLYAANAAVQIAKVLPYAKELFDLGDPVEKEAWVGHRPCFTDSLPLIAEAARHKGLWFNIGHGHSGLTIGPSSGRLLAEMLCGEKTFCDPSPYNANRWN